MNRNILAFSITTLFIVSNVSPIIVIGYQFIDPDQANLPVWSIGDFWEYDMSINCHVVLVKLDIDITRMDLKVIDINEDDDEYILGISGYIERIAYNEWGIPIKAKYLSGNARINKSTLAMKDFTLILTGNSQGVLKVDFNIIMKMEFNTNFDFLGFPIIINEEPWNITTNTNFTINVNVNVNGADKPFEYELIDKSVNDTLSVIKKESHTVPAGDFESFLISGIIGDHSELWYSPEVGYLVKVDENIERFLKAIEFGCYLELLSTNFNHPENNDAPNIPDIGGPTNGKVGGEYEYTFSTTDSDGEQVYYKIDWGDGTCSDWLGPYASGNEVVEKHTWSDKAIYKIRVKAKDENGYQTAWSDSFAVTMPRSKATYNSLFLRLFERFPLLERLFYLIK